MLGVFSAPRVGLEHTTFGLTVTHRSSVQSEQVLFGAVLSKNFDPSCCLVSSCAVWYGYTFGYTWRAMPRPEQSGIGFGWVISTSRPTENVVLIDKATLG